MTQLAAALQPENPALFPVTAALHRPPASPIANVGENRIKWEH